MRYVGIGPEKGHEVEESDAFEYAVHHLDELPEGDKQDFIDWFFSGNWMRDYEK